MSEENSSLSKAQMEKERNVTNNANNIRAAADIASKTNNPYAKAIGTAVKTADKISGGKASQKLGKQLNTINKMSGLGGKIAQKALNKMSESGTTDRIASAVNKKNNSTGVQNKKALTKQSQNASSDSTLKKQTEEQPSEASGTDFQVSIKVVKMLAIAAIPVFTIVIFCCLFISASQTYLSAITFGTADKLTGEGVDDYINKKGEDGLDDEITDDDLSYDVYINDEKVIIFRNNKLLNGSVIQVSDKYITRKYNEASLAEIEDFFPAINDTSKNYDENMVYDFFFKMYNLYITYRDTYNVKLDLPLLMATLSLQSTDRNIVFSSNLSDVDRQSTARKLPIAEFDYYYDWSTYKISKNNSEHDMEILAQHMVSEKPVEECTADTLANDGKCYGIDNEKYKAFLREFLEKKYYLDESYIEDTPSQDANKENLSCTTYTEFIKYNLTEDQLLQIASLAQQEQGTAKGAAAEASLMANLFEAYGSKYGTGADGLYNYVRNSGWFANSAKFMDGRAARAEVVVAVRSVLIEGKRTLPGYIDEHDNFGDITSVTNSGVSIEKTDKTSYIKFNTIIKNRMGSTYTFYSFPDTNSDPFGYTSEYRREKKGEFYYDYDTGNPLYCTDESGNTSLNTSPAVGDYKEWKQCNESWSNKIVPTSSSTMCKIGCLITAVTKQIVRSGTVITTDSIDPGIAMEKFDFVDGGKFVWDSAKNIAPNFRYYTAINLVGMTQRAIAQKLASYDATRYYIILAVSKKDRNKVHHYVALDYVDLSNNKIYIMDSSTVSYTDLYEGYKVYNAYIYEKRD